MGDSAIKLIIMPQILIADDHAVTRRGIKEILTEAFPTGTVDTVNDAEQLMQKIIKEKWDIIISDISMPGRSGLDILKDVTLQQKKIPVLILSIYLEEEYAVRAMKAGAAGYLNKYYTEEDELIKAVECVLSGKKYITYATANQLVNVLSVDYNRFPHEKLSNKEYEVFKLIIQGKTTGEIALQLSLSVNTIATFRSRILTKMNIRNNAGLITYAIKNKIE